MAANSDNNNDVAETEEQGIFDPFMALDYFDDVDHLLYQITGSLYSFASLSSGQFWTAGNLMKQVVDVVEVVRRHEGVEDPLLLSHVVVVVAVCRRAERE
jgi:hypothetical protein